MDYTTAVKAYAKMMGVSESEAREDAEKLVLSYMKELKCGREFAEQTFIEEQEDADPELLKEMEKKAKANGASKVTARQVVDPSGKRKTRERKPNEAKREIMQDLLKALQEYEGATLTNPERQVDFTFGGVQYSVTLTAHRKPKG